MHGTPAVTDVCPSSDMDIYGRTEEGTICNPCSHRPANWMFSTEALHQYRDHLVLWYRKLVSL